MFTHSEAVISLFIRMVNAFGESGAIGHKMSLRTKQTIRCFSWLGATTNFCFTLSTLALESKPNDTLSPCVNKCWLAHFLKCFVTTSKTTCLGWPSSSNRVNKAYSADSPPSCNRIQMKLCNEANTSRVGFCSAEVTCSLIIGSKTF